MVIAGADVQKSWDAVAKQVADTFAAALKEEGVDLSAITDKKGAIDLAKLSENPEVLDTLSALTTPLAVNVNMNGATELPADIITLIAGKNINLTLELADDMSWTINGNTVTGTDFSKIDLNVTKNATKIPVDIVNQVRGENYSMQIELAHNGAFGFTATLNINLEKENAGYYANLFYYNEETETEAEKEALEFMESVQIDKDGNATLDFVHASAYTIVISAEPMNAADPAANADDSTGDDEKDAAVSTTTGTTVEAQDQTGNNTWIWILVILGAVLVVGGVLVFVKKKQEDNKEEN